MSTRNSSPFCKTLIIPAMVFISGLCAISAAADGHPDDLFLSAERLLQTITDRQPVVLVDIRSEDDFLRCRIPGSINIPLAFIKTKAFLKKKALVLVSQGYDQRYMKAECRRLKQGGFEAAILLGGIFAWRQAGGKLAGDLTALESPVPMAPRRFLSQQHLAGQAGSGRRKDAKDCLPCRRHK